MTTHAEHVAAWKRRNPERHAEIEARYESSDKGKATRRRARAAWKQRNVEYVRERKRIGMRVLNAVATGRLVKEPCAICGAEDVHGHHANGYAMEHELDVVWLCTSHHRDAHR